MPKVNQHPVRQNTVTWQALLWRLFGTTAHCKALSDDRQIIRSCHRKTQSSRYPLAHIIPSSFSILSLTACFHLDSSIGEVGWPAIPQQDIPKNKGQNFLPQMPARQTLKYFRKNISKNNPRWKFGLKNLMIWMVFLTYVCDFWFCKFYLVYFIVWFIVVEVSNRGSSWCRFWSGFPLIMISVLSWF